MSTQVPVRPMPANSKVTPDEALAKYQEEQRAIMNGLRPKITKAFAAIHKSEEFTIEGALKAFAIPSDSK